MEVAGLAPSPSPQADLMSLDPASSHAIAAAAKSGARLRGGLGIKLAA